MSTPGLSSGDAFLASAAKAYFEGLFQSPPMLEGAALDASVKWNPAIQFQINDHLTVVVEPSETPYPVIFRLRLADILSLQHPIAVYAVCPEEAYLKEQTEAKALIADGYGLLTVAADGSVQKRASCIPLIQRITQKEFAAEIAELPPRLRRRLAESFDRYQHSAPSGTADVAEVIEGMVLKAGRESARKKWINKSDARPGAPADTLAAMQKVPQCKNALAAIGAAQGYISMYRNLNHHFPKDKKQAAKKYKDCRHGFLEGLKKIVFFREAMRKIHLSGGF